MTDYIKREDVIALAWDVTYKNEWHMHEHDEVVSVSDIAGIPSADVVSGQDFRDCRNELCLKCGQYQTKHLGSCNGCRWEKR